MRLIPLLTAALVTAFLFFLVIERDRLMAFVSGGEGAPATVAEDGGDTADAVGPVEEEQATGAVRVIALKSTARMIDSAVRLRGETEASRQVDVRAETTGQVASEPLRKGQTVERGDLLCRIDEGTRGASLAEAQARLAEARARVPEAEARIPEAEARLEEARARMEEAQINANAADKLSKDGFASETRVASTAAALRSAQASMSGAEAALKAARSGVESTEAGIQSAEAAVAAAKREIERLTITAPFSGLLESDTAELGSLLQPGGLCATIIQLDPIRIVAFVPETEVGRIEVGARAMARITGGQEVVGTVTFLSRSADTLTRTFRVEVEVDNADGRLRDGQTAEMMVAAEGAMAHLLPQSSLTLNDDGDIGVRIVGEGNIARFRPVSLLRDTIDGIYVGGLPDEVSVITVGQEYVIDGVPVVPEYATGEAEG